MYGACRKSHVAKRTSYELCQEPGEGAGNGQAGSAGGQCQEGPDPWAALKAPTAGAETRCCAPLRVPRRWGTSRVILVFLFPTFPGWQWWAPRRLPLCLPAVPRVAVAGLVSGGQEGRAARRDGDGDGGGAAPRAVIPHLGLLLLRSLILARQRSLAVRDGPSDGDGSSAGHICGSATVPGFPGLEPGTVASGGLGPPLAIPPAPPLVLSLEESRPQRRQAATSQQLQATNLPLPPPPLEAPPRCSGSGTDDRLRPRVPKDKALRRGAGQDSGRRDTYCSVQRATASAFFCSFLPSGNRAIVHHRRGTRFPNCHPGFPASWSNPWEPTACANSLALPLARLILPAAWRTLHGRHLR